MKTEKIKTAEEKKELIVNLYAEQGIESDPPDDYDFAVYEAYTRVIIEDMMPNIEFLNKLKNQVYSKASKIYKRYGPGQDAYTMQKELIKMGLWVLDRIKSQLTDKYKNLNADDLCPDCGILRNENGKCLCS